MQTEFNDCIEPFDREKFVALLNGGKKDLHGQTYTAQAYAVQTYTVQTYAMHT